MNNENPTAWKIWKIVRINGNNINLVIVYPRELIKLTGQHSEDYKSRMLHSLYEVAIDRGLKPCPVEVVTELVNNYREWRGCDKFFIITTPIIISERVSRFWIERMYHFSQDETLWDGCHCSFETRKASEAYSGEDLMLFSI